MYRRAPSSFLRHCHCHWLNHTTWSHRNCWPSPLYTTWYGRCHLVSCGPGYVWLAEPYHMVPLESSAAAKHGIWVNIASFFLHNTDANMLYRLFGDHKYIDIYLPISWKTKKQFVFSCISLSILVTFTFTPCKLHKMWADSQ